MRNEFTLKSDDQSPEKVALARRQEREKETDLNFARGGLSAKVGRIATGDGAARQIAGEAQSAEEKERKERTDRQLLLISLDEARAFADQRGADADRYERGFEAEFGDAWREEIANRVMDPDEIPERQPGESMEDYRARLEDELIERMIDPETGAIRPEYANNPEFSDYAQWALARHEEREARTYIEQRSDPNLTPEQQQAIDEKFAASATGNEVRQAAQEAARSGEHIDQLDQETDARADESMQASSVGVENDAFGLG